MKQARGSGRKSSHIPESRRRREPTTKNVPTTSKEVDHSSAGVRQPQVKKRKRPSPSVEVDKIRGRKKWKPLAQSVTVALDKMLGLSVLSVLSMKLKEKEETQKHLNILKERFLASCVQLTVPPRKQVDLGQESRQYQTESLKAEEGEKRLKSLEENHRSVVNALEELEVTRDRLDEECRILKFKVEELEETSQEILQRKEQTVLHLPPLPSRSEVDPPLQANSPANIPRVIILVGLLQVVTCVMVILHLTGHIQSGTEKNPVEVKPLVEPHHRQHIRSVKKPRIRTPVVAHLPIKPSSTHTQREVRATLIHWNAEQGFLSQFGYQDGRILVRKPGLFYVYAKTCFRYYDELEPHPRGSPSDHRLAATSSPVQLIQYIFHERPSGGATVRPTVIMKSGSTQHWRVGGYHMYCQQQGGAIALRTGDGLFVRVSNAWMLDPEAEGSYFGMFRISR